MSFEGIIGNNRIKQELTEAVNNDTVLHSYMFVGQDGIGKRMFAEEFAKEILCLSDNKECNTCNSCIKFNSGNNPDFIELEPEGNSIKIAQVRQMQKDIYQKPIVSNKKVFIINDSDKMTEEAQNSLLKTLEEPPEYVVIILITSAENKLLNTVKSRCIKINFTRLDTKEMVQYIKEKNIMQLPSKSMLEMCDGSLGRLTKVNENLEEYNEIEQITNKFIDGKITNMVDMFNQFEILYKSKEIVTQLLDYMVVIIYKYMRENNDYRNKFLNLISIIEKSKIKLASNSNYDMSIDELLLKMWERE